MVYEVDEKQWAFDDVGTEAYVTSVYPDGTYQIEVTFSDQSVETYSSELEGEFPPFPEFRCFHEDSITWSSWSNPDDPESIEVHMGVVGGEWFDACGWLPPDATSCSLGGGAVVELSNEYEFEVLFKSGGGKRSGFVATRFPGSGRVVLGDQALPLSDVRIQVAPIGTCNWQDPTPGMPTLTCEHGTYSPERVQVPSHHRVRAVASQQLPESPKRFVEVVNYPAWDPGLVFELGAGHNPEIPLIKFPEPVILQAGLFSGSPAWFPMTVFLQSDPDDVPYKTENRIPAFVCYSVPSKAEHRNGYANGLPGRKSHDENAVVLADWMRGVAASMVEQAPMDGRAWIPDAAIDDLRFDVVCHSMGGLITRALTTSQDSMGRQIRQVVSMDGVHCGTEFADLAGWLAVGFKEKYLNGTHLYPGWNDSHKELDGSPEYLLYSCVATRLAWCANNLVVLPDKSAFGVGRRYALGTFYSEKRFVYGPAKAVPEFHTQINGNPERAREVSNYLAYGRKPPGAILPITDCTSGPNCVPDLGCGNSFQPGPPIEPGDWAGSEAVANGSTVSIVISFDSNTSVTCQLLFNGVGGSYAFKDHLGAQVPWNLLESQTFDTQATLETVEIPAPQTGDVFLELTAAGDDLEVFYGFAFSNGRYLAGEAPPGVTPAGDPIEISASLFDAVGDILVGTSGTIMAEVRDPIGTLATVQLLDDGASGDGAAGDGVYGGSYAATSTEGVYGLYLEGQVVLGRETVTRSADTIAVVGVTGAQLIGSPSENLVDTNSNALIDVLELHQSVGFTKNGRYRLLGRLETSTGNLVAELREDIERTTGPGSEILVMALSAEQLAEGEADGPWVLTDRRIVSVDADFLATDSAAPHLTQPHPLAQFDPPPEPEPTVLMPDTGSRNGGYSIFLQGTKLGNIDAVFIGVNPATVVVHSDYSVEIVVPPMNQLAGLRPTSRSFVDIRVTTPWHDLVFEDAFSYGRDLLAPR
ncbi:MAG: hypothetical protein ACI8QZ_003590 [Chlamydiales bacterium]|jgi:hypothetical protein